MPLVSVVIKMTPSFTISIAQHWPRGVKVLASRFHYGLPAGDDFHPSESVRQIFSLGRLANNFTEARDFRILRKRLRRDGDAGPQMFGLKSHTFHLVSNQATSDCLYQLRKSF
jgi:hypothetical protein